MLFENGVSRAIFSLLIVFGFAPDLKCDSSQVVQPFSVGERLEFKVYLGVILGGHATMSVEGIEEIDGHPCLKIVSEAHSNRMVDMFYKVRDRITSWSDMRGEPFSRRYEKRLHEGRYRTYKRVEYKPESGMAFLYRNKAVYPDSLEINCLVQDILSAFYYIRTKDLVVGESVWVDVHDIDKRYDLEVMVLRREEINVPMGKFNCLVIEPRLMSAGIFRREGRMQIWLTDDEYKLPVIMRSKLYFGSVWAKLTGFRLGNE